MLFISVTALMGGLALFLLGMHLITDGLHKAAARQVQYILGHVTRNRFYGMLAGLLVTIILQTSAVTTVLLVGFVSAGLMNLSQALGVILGAAIGSTLTPQLIAFNLGDYALWAVVAGLIPYLFSKRLRWRHLGEAVIGFGLIFYGAGVMGQAAAPLKSLPEFIALLDRLASFPWLMAGVATLFTALVQASTPTVVLAMTLASQGSLSLPSALAMVLGANLGTTATAFISSLAHSREAKRVALVHFLFKLGGVFIFLPLLNLYTWLAETTSPDIARQVANGHTLFNVINMLIFIWFTPWMGRLATRILPDAPEEEKVAKYLDSTVVEVPEVALTNVVRELLRMANVINREMFPRVMQPLAAREVDLLEKLKGLDNLLDYLYHAIARYLIRIPETNLSEEQSILKIKLLYIASDLEHIGDVLVEMAHQWQKIETTGVEFSPQGQTELHEMFEKVRENFNAAVEAFATNDEGAAVQIIRRHPEILRLEKDLRCSHFQRLQQENRLSLETTSVHMELINQFLRLNLHSVSIAQAVMGII
ncbi:Na/Pi cotransporter family protein [Thermanaeromonas sp. C210]|uniref:Na/Pi cotransporter family protein n=1 Tax=Thermanaeromonas sp. C210 TaxID=2731925 RepID=UPI00155C32AF|nr:Na/Pi cotransporter family protein [Thermanaeromonas sp. C210]GFN24239.1 Na/Pi cotransporter II-like protein [Thermanaeromonas sp. C210]